MSPILSTLVDLQRNLLRAVDSLPDDERNEFLMALVGETRSRTITLGDWAPTEQPRTEPVR